MTLLYVPLIQSYAKDLTFADVGGLWNTNNEMISVAVKSGAARATMIDMQPEGNEWWQKFDKRCQKLGVSGYSKIFGNIDDPSLMERTGQYEFVHCSGVIYHCPNPVWTIHQLHKMTKKFLLLNSIVLPKTVSNSLGEIDLSQGKCLFLPSLSEQSVLILNEHFRNLGVEKIFGGEKWWTATGPDYSPWWWLWTIETLAGMVESCGFRVVQTGMSWQNCAHFVLAEKI